MKISKKLVGTLLILLFLCTNIYAAPAGNTSDTKTPYGDGVLGLNRTLGTLKVSLDAESIIERELEETGNVTESELEGEWYMLKIAYPIFDNVIEPYFRIGGSHLETSWKHNGGVVIMKAENDIAWGIGAKFLAYEDPQLNNLKFVLDAQYRSSDPDVDDVTVDQPSRSVTAADFKADEWQISGVVSIEIPLGAKSKSRYKKSDVCSLVPYVGLAYTDCDITSQFTYDDTNYSIGDGGNDTKLSVIGGCDLLLPKNASLNIEAKAVGETSVSGGGTIKF